MSPSRLLGALALAAVPLAACSSSRGGGTGGSAGSTTAGSICDSDPRATPYAAGLSATSTGDTVKVSFVGATPSPPAKGENTWTIKVVDNKGDPMENAAITLYPFMPDHGHGSSIVPQVMPMSTAGTYQITLIDLFMPGIWQNTFTITPASGSPATVVFTFCVDG